MILGKAEVKGDSQQSGQQVQGPAAEERSMKCEILRLTAAASQSRTKNNTRSDHGRWAGTDLFPPCISFKYLVVIPLVPQNKGKQ